MKGLIIKTTNGLIKDLNDIIEVNRNFRDMDDREFENFLNEIQIDEKFKQEYKKEYNNFWKNPEQKFYSINGFNKYGEIVGINFVREFKATIV